MIHILQIGLGPLGIKIAQYIQERDSMQTIAAVDIDENIAGQNFGSFSNLTATDFVIKSSIDQVEILNDIDIIVLTTSSGLVPITAQIDALLDYSIPIVSTCEELTFPLTNPELFNKINDKAKDKGVAVLSTGVNPGFLMDTLPTMMTAVSKSVDHVKVNRFQDARTRRLPFQKKIGAGLDLDSFQRRIDSGSLRHVGLKESMLFIADAMGWEIDHTEDVISPIIAEDHIETAQMNIQKGLAMGVRQVGKASYKGKERVHLVFEAAVGSGTSYDEIMIKGEPNIHSKIEGGVHGDIATCSIVLNSIPRVVDAPAGLLTMKDLPIVHYKS